MPEEVMKTFASVLEENRNIGPGFDFLRVFIAVCIVYLHSWTVTNRYFVPTNWDETPVWMLHFVVVPVFFVISGFLTSASAGRLTLKNFAINRAMRIVPALAATTAICALVIGPIFTTVSLRQYFFSKAFLVYFFNILGWVHYFLPGVFATHAVSEVNGSLWTVPFEFGCYAIIAGLILFRLIRSRWIMLAVVIFYILLSMLVGAVGLVTKVHSAGLARVISVAFLDHEPAAVTSFMLGIVSYQLRDRIYYSRWIFCLCVILLTVIAFMVPTWAKGLTPALRFLTLPAIVYMTVFIGLTRVPLPKFFGTGDYSYGVYLYHQPILQILVSLFPALALGSDMAPHFVFFVGVPLSIGAAWLSWHLVEKRMLALRRRFTIVAKQRGITATADSAAPRDTSGRPLPTP